MKLKESNEFMDFGGENAFGPSPLEQHLKDCHIPSNVSRAIFEHVMAPPRIDRLPSIDIGLMPVISGLIGIPVMRECDVEYLETDLTVFLPVAGEALDKILQKTGLADLEAVIARFNDLAKEENLEIVVGYDDGEEGADSAAPADSMPENPEKGFVIVNIYKKDDYEYQGRMGKENEDFIDIFDYELF